eukprot:gene46197-57606_t
MGRRPDASALFPLRVRIRAGDLAIASRDGPSGFRLGGAGVVGDVRAGWGVSLAGSVRSAPAGRFCLRARVGFACLAGAGASDAEKPPWFSPMGAFVVL